MSPEEARKLAEEHWAWLESVLDTASAKTDTLHGKLYVDAFIHGAKHGQDTQERRVM